MSDPGNSNPENNPPPPSTPPPPGGTPPPPSTPPPPGGTPPPPSTPPPPGGTPPPPSTPPPPGGTPPPPSAPPPPAYSAGAPVPVPGGAVLAEAWKRIVATLLDGILLYIVVGIPLSLIASALFDGSSSAASLTTLNVASIIGGVITALIYFAYFALMIANTGTTVGGMVMKLKVKDQNGGDVTMEQAMKRSSWLLLGIFPILGGCASFILVIWGLVSLFTDPLRQVPWDKFGETIVIDAS